MSSLADDRTAKAVIRDEAMRLFAARGADAVTVRDIAAAASVSPALVIRHYGSKDGLRAAVDAHVLAQFEAMIAVATGTDHTDPSEGGSLLESATRFFPEGSPLPEYLGRLLIADGPAGRELFQRLFELSRTGLDSMVRSGTAVAGANPDVRAALLLANDLAVIVLRARIHEALGIDPLSAEGIVRWGRELLAVYGGGLSAPVAPLDEGRQDESQEGPETGPENGKGDSDVHGS